MVVFEKVVVFGQKWLNSGKVVVFWQMFLYSGKSGCIRSRWLYSGKSGCNQAKFARCIREVVVFGNCDCIRESGCVRANVVVLG